jgi:hypothetical protein
MYVWTDGGTRRENVTALRVLAVCRGRRNESVGGEPSERTLVQDKRWPVIIVEQSNAPALIEAGAASFYVAIKALFMVMKEVAPENSICI